MVQVFTAKPETSEIVKGGFGHERDRNTRNEVLLTREHHLSRKLQVIGKNCNEDVLHTANVPNTPSGRHC